MEALKDDVGMGGDDQQSANQQSANQQSQGGLGGIGDKLKAAAASLASLGGKNEGMDLCDASYQVVLKCYTVTVSDATHDHSLGQSQKTVDAAVDQADNEQISDFLRSQCKSNSGKDLMAAQKDAA